MVTTGDYNVVCIFFLNKKKWFESLASSRVIQKLIWYTYCHDHFIPSLENQNVFQRNKLLRKLGKWIQNHSRHLLWQETRNEISYISTDNTSLRGKTETGKECVRMKYTQGSVPHENLRSICSRLVCECGEIDYVSNRRFSRYIQMWRWMWAVAFRNF